jgi:peptidoglycan hydrolase-like protein with peptidoglycan-binding domain
MREEEEAEVRRWRPAKLFAIATSGLLSVAVSYNALFAQSGVHHMAAQDNAARVEVDIPTGGSTIQLKYDPVVEALQRQLFAAGHYKGTIDGVLGKKTRNAIMSYQTAVGMDATGEPSPELIEHIRFTREVAEASLFTGTVDAAPDAEARANVRRVQTGLAELAYGPGEINGELTEATRRAIRAFQHDRNMPETGEITPELLTELAKLSGQSELAAE